MTIGKPDYSLPLDLGAIIAVAAFLGIIHFFAPETLKQTLAFSHERFSVYTLSTAAYVHNGQAHLVGNIVGYLLATIYAYMLCVAVDERRASSASPRSWC